MHLSVSLSLRHYRLCQEMKAQMCLAVGKGKGGGGKMKEMVCVALVGLQGKLVAKMPYKIPYKVEFF